MSCIENKYLKQTSLNFDDKKYIGTVSVSVSQYCTYMITHAGTSENHCFTPTMNHSSWIFYIATKDCSLYNK